MNQEKRFLGVKKKWFGAFKEIVKHSKLQKSAASRIFKIKQRQVMLDAFLKFKETSLCSAKKIESSKIAQAEVAIVSVQADLDSISTKIIDLESRKWDKIDLSILETSLDKHRAKEIYKDMQNYVSEAIQDMNVRIIQDKSDVVGRINEILSLIEQRVHKDDIEKIKSQMKNTEKYITHVAINNHISKEQTSINNTESNIDKYLSHLRMHDNNFSLLQRKLEMQEDKLNWLLSSTKLSSHKRFKSSISNLHNAPNLMSLDGSQHELKTLDLLSDANASYMKHPSRTHANI